MGRVLDSNMHTQRPRPLILCHHSHFCGGNMHTQRPRPLILCHHSHFCGVHYQERSHFRCLWLHAPRCAGIYNIILCSVNHQLPASINYRPSVHRLLAHRFSELYGTITDKHGLHFDLNYWPYCIWAILGTCTWPKCHLCRSSLLLCRK